MVELDLANVSEDVKKMNPGIFPDVGNRKKPNKYRNVRTFAVDRTFASGREAVRAGELNLLLRAGEIFCLEYQVRFPLAKGIDYIADFVYLDKQLNVVVEDAKGFRTKEYKLKRNLFTVKYSGKEIKEV